MRTKIITLAAVLIVLAGAGILMYPIISNMVFQNSQHELIEFYEKQIHDIPEEEKDTMLHDCEEYNQRLIDSKVQLTDPFDTGALNLEEHPYIDLLNRNGDGAMGSIDIPSIRCKLVVYHNTDEEALAKGIGHLQGTSLPVGGKGTHCVLSGHTGTADKELFTNLDQLKDGDIFYLHVWGRTLAYKVDQKLVVLPTETDALYIDREQDYVTLVTCTPYGINSHRLLVRGIRIPYEEAKQIEDTNAPVVLNTWGSQYFLAILAGLGISVVVVVLIVLVYRYVLRKKRRRSSEDKSQDTSEETALNKSADISDNAAPAEDKPADTAAEGTSTTAKNSADTDSEDTAAASDKDNRDNKNRD